MVRDPTLRMQAWLKGTNTDISKVAAALQEARECHNVDQRQMYTKRFKEAEEVLQRYCGIFKGALTNGEAPPKQDMVHAEAKVSETKTSLSACSKLKLLLI